MPISEFLQQCLSSGTKNRFFGELRSNASRKNRRNRSTEKATHVEVCEARTLLAAAMTSSATNDINDGQSELASADIEGRKIGKFIVFNRWTHTATNGGGLTQGTPTTLTWSFPADGVITDTDLNPSAPNNLLNFLDTTFGAGTGSDLTQRPWFHIFQKSVDRIEELAGLTYNFITQDDGVAMRFENIGILNQRADVRIMGKNLDGPFNTLAYNAFPNDGDMTIDTTEGAFLGNSSNDFRAFRNLLMHEFLHGLGVDHVDSSDSNILLEPLMNTSFDGPQLDDILAIQRSYGDVLEKGAGNNTFQTAFNLGAVAPGTTVSRGTLGDSTSVDATQTDFVSIDDETDQDFYKFMVSSAGTVTITLSPRGTTYMVGPEGGTQASFNSRNQSDLTVKLLGEDGVTVLQTRNAGSFGVNEVIQDFMLSSPGTYYVQVTGATTDKIQLYGLDVSFSRSPGHQFFGTMFNDFNRNGLFDSGETGAPGIRVYNDSNSNSRYDNGEPSTFSTADGTYALAGVPNVYDVRVELPANRQSTMPDGTIISNGFAPGPGSDFSGPEYDFGSIALPIGTSGNDAFVLTYSPNDVTITISTNGGSPTSIGTFPLTSPLTIDGAGGTDSVRIVGTSGNDEFFVNSNTAIETNSHQVTLTSIEQKTLAGAAGSDNYVFDADAALGTFTLDESGGGVDLLDFFLSNLAVNVNLGLSTSQVVNANLSLILGAINTFENVEGGQGHDTLTGNALDNMLSGNVGDDHLTGLAGNDALRGGVGGDTYFFDADTQLGADILTEDADPGFDLLNFSQTSANVDIDLGRTTQQLVNSNLRLTLSANNTFDDVDGGSGNDRITGNSLLNFINGNNGNDVLIGLGGNDDMTGGAGDDTFVFSAATLAESDVVRENVNGGTDTLDFAALTSNLSINLGLTSAQPVHVLRSLTLATNAIENVTGGSGADTLLGNSLNNTLRGGPGADQLTGAAGNDLLFGGANDDTYIFGPAAAAEADQVSENVNEGTDTLNFATVTTNIALHMGSNVAQNVHANRTLRLNSPITFENAHGGSGADNLIGNALNNTLRGGPGNDTLIGALGNDLLFGGANNDTYLFGAASVAEADEVSENVNEGTDTLDFRFLTSNVVLNMAANVAQPVHANRTLKLNSPITFENAIGGGGSDNLIGNSLNNTLIGGAGNDTLIGALGNDLLLGGANNDTYLFGPASALEADQVTENANEGTDTLSFAFLTTSVVVNLAENANQALHLNRTLKLNSPITFENFTGGSGADTLIGNSLANVLTGGPGDDTLNGSGGSDVLIGGANNDTYLFGAATTAEADQVIENANEGIDTLNFAFLTTVWSAIRVAIFCLAATMTTSWCPGLSISG
jgi:Ca2+-binding RTX toxin-like protein